MATPSPLGAYAQTQILYDRELGRTLERAAKDIQARIKKLEAKGGVGATVRRSQLALVLDEINQVLHTMWVLGVLPTVVRGRKAAAEAALKAQEDLERVMYSAMSEKAADALREGLRATARAGIDNAHKRVPRELSRRVYNDLALTSGQVENTIRSGIASGLSAKELADDVYKHVSPTVPGGASYAAMRLARTEINNAFHQQQIAGGQRPGVKAIRWNLSGSHKKPDECNLFAANDGPQGRGTWAVTDVPGKPHPQCLCYMTYEMMGEDEFLDALFGEKFGDQVDKKTQDKVEKAQAESPPPKRKATTPPGESVPSTGPNFSSDIKGKDREVVDKALAHQGTLAPACLERLESVDYMTHADLVALGSPDILGEYLPDRQRIALSRDMFGPFFLDKWRKMSGKGWFSRCGHDHEGAESLIHHEFGHHVAHWLDQAPVRIRKRFWDQVAQALGAPTSPDQPDVPGVEFWCEENEDLIRDKVSEYASTSGLEVLAEIWQEYSTMGDKARPWIKTIGDLMADIAETEAI